MIPLLFGARSESKKAKFSGRPERDFLRGLYSYTCFRQQPQLAAAQGEDAGPLLNHAVTAHRPKKVRQTKEKLSGRPRITGSGPMNGVKGTMETALWPKSETLAGCD